MKLPLIGAISRACKHLQVALVISLITCQSPLQAEMGSFESPETSTPDPATRQLGALNINAATPAALASQLKGIGPSKAEAIVKFREKHGAFATVDALVNVKGIGKKTVEKLRAKIVAGPYQKPKKGESLAEQERSARAAVQSIVQRSLEIRRAANQSE